MELSYSKSRGLSSLACLRLDKPTGTYIDVGAGHPNLPNTCRWVRGFYELGGLGSGRCSRARSLNFAALYRRLAPSARISRFPGLSERPRGEIRLPMWSKSAWVLERQ